jgi:hypothetical protein
MSNVFNRIQYPVVEPAPDVDQVFSNFRFSDYGNIAGLTFGTLMLTNLISTFGLRSVIYTVCACTLWGVLFWARARLFRCNLILFHVSRRSQAT